MDRSGCTCVSCDGIASVEVAGAVEDKYKARLGPWILYSRIPRGKDQLVFETKPVFSLKRGVTVSFEVDG